MTDWAVSYTVAARVPVPVGAHGSPPPGNRPVRGGGTDPAHGRPGGGETGGPPPGDGRSRPAVRSPRHDSVRIGMYQRPCAGLCSVKGAARGGHRRPQGRDVMHPMFVKLFIEAGADDLAAEEEARRRRAARSRHDRAAVAVRGASRDRHLRPGGDGRPSACPRLPASTQHTRLRQDRASPPISPIGDSFPPEGAVS